MSDPNAEARKIVQSFVSMHNELQSLKSLVGRSMKVGPVHVVDAEKGYRLLLGERNGKQFLSPWYPHPESGKTSIPLEVGQVVGVVNPNGDPRQGFMIRAGYNALHPSPNGDLAANVFSAGGVTVKATPGQLSIEIGGVTWTLSAEGFSQTGGKVRHDEKDIGKTHIHGGVFVGSEKTEPPV